jgi:hypothetical protein
MPSYTFFGLLGKNSIYKISSFDKEGEQLKLKQRLLDSLTEIPELS